MVQCGLALVLRRSCLDGDADGSIIDEVGQIPEFLICLIWLPCEIKSWNSHQFLLMLAQLLYRVDLSRDAVRADISTNTCAKHHHALR